jgi:orotidine-5'-phosphate decarboxylase
MKTITLRRKFMFLLLALCPFVFSALLGCDERKTIIFPPQCDTMQRLHEGMKKSLLCVGLDPDPTKMPDEINHMILEPEQKLRYFVSSVVSVTAPYVCAYKLQRAFYDDQELLKRIVEYIHEYDPQIPVIIDQKIGDIDNTMNAWTNSLFGDLKADAITVNPYMGTEVVQPFMKDKNKVGAVLIRTSNPGAACVQDAVLQNGKKVWEHVLDLTVQEWNVNRNLMIVLGANAKAHEQCAHIRTIIPDEMPILVPGIGAQGGDMASIKPLLNSRKGGVIVNSSRAILYPPKTAVNEKMSWQEKIGDAAKDVRDKLNIIRYEQ